jgi:hypothetical protein
MIFIVNMYLDIVDAAGATQYSYLVFADSKGIAMRTLYNYLDEEGIPQDHVIRYDVELLKFPSSNVVEMAQ